MGEVLVVVKARSELGAALGVIEGIGAPRLTSSWHEVAKALSSQRPPVHLVVTSGALSRSGAALLTRLHEKGYLIPSTVLVTTEAPAALILAGHVGTLGVEIVFGDDLERFHQVLETRQVRAARFLADLLGAKDSFARSVIRDCQDVPFDEGDPVAWLAQKRRLGRSSFYKQMKNSGLPRPTDIVTFFRLLPAVELLGRGGSADDAAFTAGLSDPTSLGRSIFRRFGLTITRARQLVEFEEIAQIWIAFQEQRKAMR